MSTYWKIEYDLRFRISYKKLQDMTDRMNIKKYTILIANHKDPGNIGGCESCPSNDSLKLVFNTGWAIVYQILGSTIRFLGFYREIPKD